MHKLGIIGIYFIGKKVLLQVITHDYSFVDTPFLKAYL